MAFDSMSKHTLLLQQQQTIDALSLKVKQLTEALDVARPQNADKYTVPGLNDAIEQTDEAGGPKRAP